MNENNINYVGPAEAINFDEDDYYMYAFGGENMENIIYILPVYKNTLMFRKTNNITMTWKKRFLTVEDAMKELSSFEYDNYIIILE